MRLKIVAGNWKMNLSFEEAEELVSSIADQLEEIDLEETEVVICPPYPYLEMALDIAIESVFSVGAQNISQFDNGAYTGEVSARMLASMDVDYCIIGHSERRKYFGETDEIIAQKIDQALKHEFIVIFCCGELLSERRAGKHFDVVRQQIEKALFSLSEEEFYNIVIAYEPVWAIGTGENATPEQAQEMHAYIRRLIASRYGNDVANETSILYGGSCNSKNAPEIFAQPDVDGGLIGGASLNADEFIKIIKAIL
ncbi:MAG TPA: triose-phosphate isomerase [Bacteroidales bacterium]|nr:triose-phosphate isomerase [Bacteroidales bacterium]